MCVAFATWVFPGVAAAQESAAVREAAEFVMKRFTKEVAGETVETVAGRLTRLCAQHGDEAIAAVKKAGPRAFRLVEQAGANGADAVRLLARYGDEAAWVVSEPRRLAQFVRHGDDAAEAMMKHKDIVLPLLDRCAGSAAQAFKTVSGRSARRLAMMEDAGELAKIGATDKLLAVVGRFGDKAADFIWRNKGALAVSAALAAFLADPEPFINGTRDLAQVAGDAAKEPLREAVRRTDWTVVVLVFGGVFLLMAVIRRRRKRIGPSAIRAGSS